MRRRLVIALGVLLGLALLPDRRRRAARAPATGPRMSAPVEPALLAEVRVSAPSAPWWRRTADVLVTALRTALKGNVTDVAASLAYYSFLAIPATLLVAVGVFGLVAGPDAIQSLTERMEGVVPDAALSLIEDSLTRVTESSGSGLGLAALGFLLALWTASGAMSALMRGLNRVHEVAETRSFASQRLTSLGLLGWCLLAVIVSFGLLVLGAPLSRAAGDALGAETLVAWLWWAAQWPILGGALLVAVAGILRSGPAGGAHSRRAVVAGALVTVAISIAASGLFAFYVAGFSSYGAAWGSLSAVIVMLTWLWLTSLAVLLGCQVEAEVERRGRAV